MTQPRLRRYSNLDGIGPKQRINDWHSRARESERKTQGINFKLIKSPDQNYRMFN